MVNTFSLFLKKHFPVKYIFHIVCIYIYMYVYTHTGIYVYKILCG